MEGSLSEKVGSVAMVILVCKDRERLPEKGFKKDEIC